MRHRDREHDHASDVALALEYPLEMPLPAGRDIAPDRFTRQLVGDGVLRMHLGAPQERVALQPRGQSARPGEELRLAVERVRSRPPPRRLDGTPTVRRDDEIDADLVQPLPDLPPRGRAAVAEVEIRRGRDGEDLRSP